MLATTTTTTAIATLDQAIPLHQEVRWGAKPGDPTTITLHSVRDHLARERAFADPGWIVRPAAQLRVGFGDGKRRALCATVDARGGELAYGAPHGFTDHGLKALARFVLPAHGMKTINALCAIDAHGAKAADLTWNKLASTQTEKPLYLRTWNVVDPHTGREARVIRHACSSQYAEIDNLEVVQHLLDLSELSSLPVLSYMKTDTAMRIRFALDPIDRFALHKPIRMIEVWNSEVGSRSVSLCDGIWFGKCTNGMASFERGHRVTVQHRGDREAQLAKLVGKIDTVKLRATGLANAYNDSLNASIDNAHQFMADIFDGVLTGQQLNRSVEALDDATTARDSHGAPRLLASVIDAVTLAAQAEIDLFRQQQMEAAAMEAMFVGLKRVENGQIMTRIADDA